MYLIKIDDWVKEFEKLELIMDLDFGGSQMIQIQRDNDKYKVVNAMNGWGDNNMDMFLDSKVKIFIEKTL